MKQVKEQATPEFGTVDFDLLRAKLEFEVDRPAVISITSSTGEDGRDTVARGLAYSLVATGYTTLLLDTSLAGRGLAKSPQRLTLEEAGRQLAADPGSGKLSVLNLGDLLLQRTTSQRHIESALGILRSKFDYVVINTEYGGSMAFATSVIATVDAVLVTVKKGRRQKAEDARLAHVLGSIGPRFLGVVALDSAIVRKNMIKSEALVPFSGIPDVRRGEVARVEKELQLRETAEWPT